MNDPTEALARFVADVEVLRECEAEAVALDPAAEANPAFRDPEALDAARAFLERVRGGLVPPPGPSAHFQLDDVLAGPGLEVALHAARAVVAEPGRRYNPLLLTGPSGTGKTHLLHGIGGLLPATDGPVACLSAHEFVDELVEAIERDRVAAWQARYRRVSALLLDDVQLLAGKDRTQEELFHLFNHLAEHDRQMVFTSGLPLAELDDLAPRLRTRLESGLGATLPPPDRGLRQEVVSRALAALGLPADPELASYLAGRQADTVRAVQGMVHRVLNAAEVRQVPPSAALAREVLEGVAPPPRAPVRAAGVVRPAGGGLRSPEKMVVAWPDLADLLLEEYR